MLTSSILSISGLVCLALSGILMSRMIPRQGKATWSWMQTDTGETTVALSQFILMIVGAALIAKAIL